MKWALFFVFLGVATFFDLPLAAALYQPESGFGSLFAALGMLPQGALIFAGPALVWSVVVTHLNYIKPLGKVVLLVLPLGSFACLYPDRGHFPDFLVVHPWLLALVLAVPAFALAAAAIPAAKKHPREVLLAGLTAVLALCAGMVVVETTKTVWGRQRFFTMTDPAVQFTAWFAPRGTAAVTAAAPALEPDSFKSFPSGHAFSALLAVWFALVPECLWGAGARAKTWAHRILGAAALFGAAVMLSRLVLGKHFLSDVLVGAAVALLCVGGFRAALVAVYPKVGTALFRSGSPL
jgi:membrane-associated phospholipid phosphatase